MIKRIYRPLTSIALGVISSLLATYLKDDMFRWLSYLIFLMAVFLIILDLYQQYPTVFGVRWRYAATGIIIKNNSVLLIWHPFYKCWLPPGSRVPFQEYPHVAVQKAIFRETGYESEFLHGIHHAIKQIDRETKQLPQPYYVALETEGHRGGIKEHYDFYYMCRVTQKKPQKNALDHVWTKINDLESLVLKGELNNDVKSIIVSAYKEVSQQ